jgi:transcription antitermination factor NusG
MMFSFADSSADRQSRGPGTVSIAPRWYAVRTRSNYEKRVSTELAAKGFECFLPIFREVHRWKDRKKLVDVPFFPGYSFVNMPATDAFRLQVLQTAGTVCILGNATQMEAIPEAEIANLRSAVSANALLHPHPFLREGAWVRVKRGPLEGLEGRLVRWKNDTRLVLSVELLCQAVSTEIEFRDVEMLCTSEQSGAPARRAARA